MSSFIDNNVTYQNFSLKNLSSINFTITTTTANYENDYSTSTPSTLQIVLETVLIYFIYPLLFLCGFLGNLFVITVLLSSQFINTNDSNNITTNVTSVSRNNSIKVKKPNNNNNNTNNNTNNNNNNNNKNNFENNIDQEKEEFLSVNKTKRNDLNNKNLVQSKDLLKVTHFFLLNLSISDLFYTTTIPILIYTMKYKRWVLNLFFCKVSMSLAYLCQFSSVYILVILSIDRFLAVKYPINMINMRNMKLARLIIFSCWILAFMFPAPIYVFTRIDRFNNEDYCTVNWPDMPNSTTLWINQNETSYFNDIKSWIYSYLHPFHIFQLYSFLLNYVIPVGIIVILYMKIIKIIKQKSFGLRNIQKSKSKIKTHRRITLMVFSIVVCYLVSWTPYWTFQIFNYIYFSVLGFTSESWLIITTHISQVSAYLSSTLNPFIYSYMSQGFRNNFQIILNKFSSSSSNARKNSLEYNDCNLVKIEYNKDKKKMKIIKKKIVEQVIVPIKDDDLNENDHLEVEEDSFVCNNNNNNKKIEEIMQIEKPSASATIDDELKDMDSNKSRIAVIWHSVKIKSSNSNKNNLNCRPVNLVSSQTNIKNGMKDSINEGDEIIPENNLASKNHVRYNYDSEDLTKEDIICDLKQLGKNFNCEPNRRCRLASEEIASNENLQLPTNNDQESDNDVEFKYKTYLYKPKEKFAVAINFHPLAKLIHYKNVKSIKKEIKRAQCSNKNSLSLSFVNNENSSNTNLANDCLEKSNSKQTHLKSPPLESMDRTQRPKSDSCEKDFKYDCV